MELRARDAAKPVVMVAVVVCLCLGASGASQTPGPTAVCTNCQEPAERLKAAQARQPRAEAEFKEATAQLRALKVTQAQDEAELEVRRGLPPSTENQARQQALQAAIKARAAAIAAMDKRTIELEVELSTLETTIRLTAQELGRCNRGCGLAPSRQAVGTTPGAGPVAADPGPTPICEDCRVLLQELEDIERRQREARDRIEASRAASNALRRELRELDELREQLNAMKVSGDPSIRLSEAEHARRMKELESRVQRIEDVEMGHQLEARQEDRDQLEKLDAELQQWWTRWNECNRRCNPKNTNWFSRPLFWIPIAGAGVLGVTVAGGDSQTPNAPATTSQPPVVAPSPTPTPTPAPTPAPPAGSSISGTYSLSGNPQSQNCRIGVLPVFVSFTGSLVLQIGSDNTGTAVSRHANGWVFTHQVQATPIDGGGFRVRSITPLANSQPFGGGWEASIDIQVTPQFAFTGAETHARRDGGPACQDSYTIQGARQ